MRFMSFNQLPLFIDDFFMREWDDLRKKDAIVIFNPPDALLESPVLLRSRKSLPDHIAHIAANRIRKAIIVAHDLDFLPQCPSLEQLWIIPGVFAPSFDYAPLYELPNIRRLYCETMFGENGRKTACVDYSRFPNLQMVSVCGPKGHQNLHLANRVVSMFCENGYPGADNLTNAFPGDSLENLSICQAPIRSLDGIEAGGQLRRLELSYNRRLTDISALHALKDSLIYLEINSCGKVADFSALSALSKLEFLILKGNNVLPDLSFLNALPKLKYLHLTMNVASGDTGVCKRIPYVRLQNRKHFTNKDQEMQKHYVDPNQAVPFHIF